MVIDRTKSWEEVTSGNKENGAIRIIDSSYYILSEEAKSTMSDSQKKIFRACTNLNNCLYQENGTCWLNAMAAFIILLQAKKEALEKRTTFTMEDIKKGFEKRPGKLSDFEHKTVLYLMSNFFTHTDSGKQIVKNLMSPDWKQNSSIIRQTNIDPDLPVHSVLVVITIKRLLLEFNENRLEAIEKLLPFRLGEIETEEQKNSELLQLLKHTCDVFELIEQDKMPRFGLVS